jgi:DNA-directed RNA polymerase subunit H (RpoH/RPB5)
MSFDSVCTTMCELLNDRKYTNIEIGDDSIVATKPNGGLVHVYYTELKMNINLVKYFYSLIRTHNITHIILIHTSSITSSANKILENITNTKIELFTSDSLQFNITKHRFVPKHERISSENVKELCKYPIIKSFDPIIKYYGFEKGNLIKITRLDGSIYFRVVRD